MSKKYINLNFVIDLENYAKSLKNWGELYSIAIPSVSREAFFNEQFDKYIEIIKPIVHENSMFKDLKKIHNLAFYTEDLNYNQVERLRKSIYQLQKWEIVVGQPEEIIKSNDVIAEPTLKRDPIYAVELHEKPKNYEVDLWGTSLPIPSVVIRGPVIHSKKIASTSLGMPTANFKVDEALGKLLINYPNGIYVGVFKFANQPDVGYRAICSLGINMHYQNDVWSRKFEAYIDHQFKEDFYGQQAEVEIRRLIRLQGLFKSFDSFLNAMSNDIWVGKHLKI